MAEPFKKPSFLSSVISGISGSIKGLFAGGAVGAMAGAIVGGLLAVITGDFASAGTIAMETAAGSAVLMGSVGAVAGTVTEVVRSREAASPSAQDVVDVAKITFTQGVAVGHQLGHAQATEEHSTKWRDKIAQQRGHQVNPNQQV